MFGLIEKCPRHVRVDFLAPRTHGIIHYWNALCQDVYEALVGRELVEHLCETTEPSTKQWLLAMLDSLSHVEFVKLEGYLSNLVGTEKGNSRRDVSESMSHIPIYC